VRKTILIATFVLLILELYAYQAFRTVFQRSWMRTLYWIITAVVYLTVVYYTLTFSQSDKSPQKIQIVISLFLGVLLPKLLIVIFLLLDDIFRLIGYGFSYFGNSETHFPARRKFLSAFGIGTAALLSGLVFDGIFFGKYRHRARKVKLKIKNLPQSCSIKFSIRSLVLN